MIPPKPKSRADKVTLWQHFKAFRADILSAQPDRLFRAKMAEFRTPFFTSYLMNQTELVDEVLKRRPNDFPKSDRLGAGLRPLLGPQSVFLSNGAQWQRQRRSIDQIFSGKQVHDSVAVMCAAIKDAKGRLKGGGTVDIEEFASHLTADIIFRVMFSMPISADIAAEVYREFRAYQRAAPILNLAAFLPKLPGLHNRQTRRSARNIRRLIEKMVAERAVEIAKGLAPNDLVTDLFNVKDPDTAETFTQAEIVDQVAIFFLAGHETSAAALGWALYLCACSKDDQQRIREEAALLPADIDFSAIAKLGHTRNVFRETLRLYPPVPMMVRQATQPETFRGRRLKPGAQIVISPWHKHRHAENWENPDAFDPNRFETPQGRQGLANAFIPFSAGPRVCPGASFGMTEGVLSLAMLINDFVFEAHNDDEPVPIAHLTIRSKNGIRLKVSPV